MEVFQHDIFNLTNLSSYLSAKDATIKLAAASDFVDRVPDNYEVVGYCEHFRFFIKKEPPKIFHNPVVQIPCPHCSKALNLGFVLSAKNHTQDKESDD